MTDLVTIPLNQLVQWKGNVRKTAPMEALEELIASLSSHGLLQSLVVRPAPANGKTKGKYHVVAGQRRLMALQEMTRRGTIPEDHPVSCHILRKDASPEEISLAENTVRLEMHPADQFEAFSRLHKNGKGMPVADIAARFGFAESTVQKLLRLARVSPMIIAAYRDGKLTLAQAQAFACTDDRKAQEHLLSDINPEYTDPDDIRHALTPKDEFPATDKRARFVGIDAYERAGGKTRRDLFTESDRGLFILDAKLLDSLVALKLCPAADEVRAEGWAWVEIVPDLPWEILHECGQIREQLILTPEQREHYEALQAEAGKLEEEWYASDDDEQPERLTSLAQQIEEIESAASGYLPEEIAIAGAFVTIDRDGEIEIRRGYVKPQDKPKLKVLHKVPASGTAPHEESAGTGEDKKALPASLTEFLTAHRSAALQASLAVNPDIGLAAAVHAIADGIFYRGGTSGSCLSTSASRKYHPAAKDFRAHDELGREESLWRDRIPGDETLFWQWCLEQDRDTLIALISFCAAHSIDATQRKNDKPDCTRLQHAHMLSAALKLDMASYFRPDADNYFDKISKDKILADIRDITGKEPPPAMLKMKKAELAATATRLAADKQWLPAILRPQEQAA